MNNEKMYLNIAPGCNEVVIREGKAPAQLEPKAPIRIDLAGTIGAPVAFLTKRIGDVDQHKCHVIVNREKVSITLVINEDDEYNHGTVVGKLSFHPKFEEFGINTGKAWIPEELGMFFQDEPCLFHRCENEHGIGINVPFIQRQREPGIRPGNKDERFVQVEFHPGREFEHAGWFQVANPDFPWHAGGDPGCGNVRTCRWS